LFILSFFSSLQEQEIQDNMEIVMEYSTLLFERKISCADISDVLEEYFIVKF
jgi:hypothetical protein